MDMKLNEILENIKEATGADITNIQEKIKTIPENKPETLVNYLQDVNDKLYAIYGVNDSILSLQVYINMLRNTHNITDQKEIINHDDGTDFVQ